MGNAKHEKFAIFLLNLVEAIVVGLYATKLARSPRKALVEEQTNLSIMTDNANSQTEYWRPLIARVAYTWSDCIFGATQAAVDDLVGNVGIAGENQSDRQPWYPSGSAWKSYGTIGPPLVQARSTTH